MSELAQSLFEPVAAVVRMHDGRKVEGARDISSRGHCLRVAMAQLVGDGPFSAVYIFAQAKDAAAAAQAIKKIDTPDGWQRLVETFPAATTEKLVRAVFDSKGWRDSILLPGLSDEVDGAIKRALMNSANADISPPLWQEIGSKIRSEAMDPRCYYMAGMGHVMPSARELDAIVENYIVDARKKMAT